VWISPRRDRAAEVRQILDEAQLPDGYLFTAEYQGGGTLTAMVEHAWDLAGLAAGYEEFITEFSQPAGADPLALVIDLVHAWRRFPWIDPGLPAQFLPVPWSGTAAAELFTRLHAERADDAIGAWQQLIARTSAGRAPAPSGHSSSPTSRS
jgi:phenylacetic acid degradation operon negative regulatory protein